MTLPESDIVSALNEICDKIEDNTATMQLIVDELVQTNERARNDVDSQVKDIREALERQYAQRIESLEQRLEQKHGHNFPFVNGPIGGRGGVGKAPANP